MKNKTVEATSRVVIKQEGFLGSVAKDVVSLGLFGFLCWFNGNFIGGGYFVNFLILCIIVTLRTKDVSYYFKVPKEKIEAIKRILASDYDLSCYLKVPAEKIEAIKKILEG